MEKLYCELEDYSNEEKSQRSVADLKTLSKSEMEDVLTKKFRNKKNYFHFAVQSNNVEIAKVLIENGADVNDKFPKPNNHEFVYLLCYAAKHNFTDMICLLIENGAEIYFTHLHDILKNNNLNVVEFIARNIDLINGYFIINNTLSLAIMYKQTDIIKTFLCHVNMDFYGFLLLFESFKTFKLMVYLNSCE